MEEVHPGLPATRHRLTRKYTVDGGAIVRVATILRNACHIQMIVWSVDCVERRCGASVENLESKDGRVKTESDCLCYYEESR